MHNFVYLAQRRSQEFSCGPNFGGGVPPVHVATLSRNRVAQQNRRCDICLTRIIQRVCVCVCVCGLNAVRSRCLGVWFE